MKWLQFLWKDQRGALTTMEIIGYTVLIGGAVTLVGYGISAALRGLTGDVITEIKNAAP
ncbi:MAG: hypothetical protein ACYC2T_08365 [Bacillota bacterium]